MEVRTAKRTYNIYMYIYLYIYTYITPFYQYTYKPRYWMISYIAYHLQCTIHWHTEHLYIFYEHLILNYFWIIKLQCIVILYRIVILYHIVILYRIVILWGGNQNYFCVYHTCSCYSIRGMSHPIVYFHTNVIKTMYM